MTTDEDAMTIYAQTKKAEKLTAKPRYKNSPENQKAIALRFSLFSYFYTDD